MDAPMACQSVAPDGVQSFLCASTHVCAHLISSSQSSWHRLGSTLPLLRAFLSLQLERDGCPETSHCTSMSLTELTSINNNSFDSSTPLWRHRGSPGRWCSAHSRYSVNICSTLANKAHSTWLLSNAQSGKYVYLPSFPERYWGRGDSSSGFQKTLWQENPMRVLCWEPLQPVYDDEWWMRPQNEILGLQPFNPSENHLFPAVNTTIRFSNQSIS